MQDVDYRSQCEPFRSCLAEVRAWSKAHPHHLPVYLLIETKRGKLNVTLTMVTPEPWTPEVVDSLDNEIRSVFRKNEIVMPEDVRGKYATLNDVICAGAWPALDHARGKVLLLMDQKSAGPA